MQATKDEYSCPYGNRAYRQNNMAMIAGVAQIPAAAHGYQVEYRTRVESTVPNGPTPTFRVEDPAKRKFSVSWAKAGVNNQIGNRCDTATHDSWGKYITESQVPHDAAKRIIRIANALKAIGYNVTDHPESRAALMSIPSYTTMSTKESIKAAVVHQ